MISYLMSRFLSLIFILWFLPLTSMHSYSLPVDSPSSSMEGCGGALSVSGLLVHPAVWSKETDLAVWPKDGLPLKCTRNIIVKEVCITKMKLDRNTFELNHCLGYLVALLSFRGSLSFSLVLFNDPVKTVGTVPAPNEICLRSSLTEGSGFLSGFRLLTSGSCK